MRTIYLLAMCLWLNACTATSPFPQEVAEETSTDTSAIKAWKEQAGYASGTSFISRKVQLGGRITQVIPKPGGVIIIAQEQPIDRHLGYGSTGAGREGAFKFAIVFSGFPDDEMLKVGNHLVVVGELDRSRPEAIGSMPLIPLPHLLAQCLHIWKMERFGTDALAYEDTNSQLEGQTFCRKEGNGKNLSTGNDRRFQVPRTTGELQPVGNSVRVPHKLPAALPGRDISLAKD